MKRDSKPGPPVTTSEVVRWNARVAAGETIKALAAETGRAHQTISRYIDERLRRPEVTAEERDRIRTLRAAGWSINKIAKEVGRSWEATARAAKGVHCKHPETHRRRPTVSGRAITALYPGKCRACGEAFAAGETITPAVADGSRTWLGPCCGIEVAW